MPPRGTGTAAANNKGKGKPGTGTDASSFTGSGSVPLNNAPALGASFLSMTANSNAARETLTQSRVVLPRFLASAMGDRAGLVAVAVAAKDASETLVGTQHHRSTSAGDDPLSGAVRGAQQIRGFFEQDAVLQILQGPATRPSAWKRQLYARGLARFRDAELASGKPVLGAETWKRLDALLLGTGNGNGTTAPVQQAGFQAVGAALHQKLLQVSQGYRADMAAYMDALDNEMDAIEQGSPTAGDANDTLQQLTMERFLYAGISTAWHLAETLHLSPAQPTTVTFGSHAMPSAASADALPDRLLSWLNVNFPAPAPGAFEALLADYQANKATRGGPADSPDFWPLVVRCLMRGNLDSVAQLLDLLAESVRPQFKVQVNALARVFLSIAQERPDPLRFRSNVEYADKFQAWKTDCAMSGSEASLKNEVAAALAAQGAMTTPGRRSARLARGANASATTSNDDQDPELYPHFATLFAILAGDRNQIASQAKTWHEALVCSLYWSQPRADLDSMRGMLLLMGLDKATLKPVDAVIFAMLLGNGAAIAQGLGALGDLWGAAHLVDLLARAGVDVEGAELGIGRMPMEDDVEMEMEGDEVVRRVVGAAGRSPFKFACAAASAGGVAGQRGPKLPAIPVRDYLLLSFALSQLASALPTLDDGSGASNASSYLPDPRLLALGYFASLKGGLAYAAMLVERIGVLQLEESGSEGVVARVGKLVEISELLGLGAGGVIQRTAGTQVFNRTMGVLQSFGAKNKKPTAEQASRVKSGFIDSLKLLLQSGETSRADAVLDAAIRHAHEANLVPSKTEIENLLNQLPAAVVLPPNLAFYSRYVEFIGMVGRREWKSAAGELEALMALHVAGTNNQDKSRTGPGMGIGGLVGLAGPVPLPSAAGGDAVGDLHLTPRAYRMAVLRSAVPLFQATLAQQAAIPLRAVKGCMVALDSLDAMDLLLGSGYTVGGGFDGKKGEERNPEELKGLRGLLVECLVGCEGFGY